MASAQKIITAMQSRGFDLTLTAAGGLAVTPASRLSDSERALIRDNRAAIMAHLTAANDAMPSDPDRHCYPHTQAWNSGEIALFQSRVSRWTTWIGESQAETLADSLVQRDRDPADDRHLCLECQHCQSGRCSNSRAAGLNHPELGKDYATLIKRCNGFQRGMGTLLTGTPLAFIQAPPRPLPKTQQYQPLTPQQKQAHRDYFQHHTVCPVCISAGQGRGARCPKGLALWQQYQEGAAS